MRIAFYNNFLRRIVIKALKVANWHLEANPNNNNKAVVKDLRIL
jgi:hypothetical protein